MRMYVPKFGRYSTQRFNIHLIKELVCFSNLHSYMPNTATAQEIKKEEQATDLRTRVVSKQTVQTSSPSHKNTTHKVVGIIFICFLVINGAIRNHAILYNQFALRLAIESCNAPIDRNAKTFIGEWQWAKRRFLSWTYLQLIVVELLPGAMLMENLGSGVKENVTVPFSPPAPFISPLRQSICVIDIGVNSEATFDLVPRAHSTFCR